MAIYPYQTEPLTDFSVNANRIAYEKALQVIQSKLGETIPLVINGEKRFEGKLSVSLNPSNHQEVVGHVHQADIALGEEAMQCALTAFE